ncbi:Retrovirus-related Pol polyprotein from transposon TNT 1-94 [Vitis vinifera]|uniref:Retrovirus-related Pol polyprotein from transposon TNT 1-94 n=1 Tax=Vitis vinifera TaxID=29760 RepID=A0A438EMK2_VITVI|nr:Retrovirus-related Pol polyprotein from transposon TNT 1-94 [Vitis vinifera]
MNNNNATIEILSGSNYKRWRSGIEFVLGMMDLDMSLREDEPPKPTNENTEAMRAHYVKWERSNCLSLISIKRFIAEHLLGGIPESNNAKEFLIATGNRYQTSDNAEVGYFMDELMNMSQINTAYNTLNQSWGVNDLITKFEKQLGKVIKIVRSDQGGEYYGKHGDVGQQNELFARVEPMDVISLPLPVSDVNLDVGAFDSGIQQGVATVNFLTIEITPIVDEIPSMEMRRSQRPRRPAFFNDYYVTSERESMKLEKKWTLLLIVKLSDINPLDANGYSRPKETTKEMLKDTRLGWLLKASSDGCQDIFLNGDFIEEVYMSQPEGFEANRKKNMNKFDQCVYMKVNRSKYIFMVLYIDDILLASSDVNLLNDTKRILSANFNMKDLREAYFVLGIEIYRDRSRNLLGLSQRAYINRVLKRFNMQTCKAGDVPVVKGYKLSNEQCPKNDLEKDAMKTIPYASAVGSLMYAQEGLQDDCSKDIFEMELEDMEEPADDVENDGAGDRLIEYFSTA